MFNRKLGSINAKYLLDDTPNNYSRNYRIYIAKKIGWPNYDLPPQAFFQKVMSTKSNSDRFSLNCTMRAFIV